MYHQRKYWIANGYLFREVINIIFLQIFQNNGCVNCFIWQLIHDKYKNSKNQPPSHSLLYRCVTKLWSKKFLGLFFVISWSFPTNQFSTSKTFTYYMRQFEKIWTRKDTAMDIIKLLEGSDPLFAVAGLNDNSLRFHSW